MMMNKEETAALLQRYLEGNCSREEKATVESWYNLRGLNNVPLAVGKDLDLTGQLIWNDILMQAPAPKNKMLGFSRIVAAAAILMLGLGVWFYVARQDRYAELEKLSRLKHNDIAPGRNVATLTLADGKVVKLNDTKTALVIGNDKLVYNDGTEVTKSDAGQSVAGSRGVAKDAALKWLTASTPRGGQYQIVLPDGSKVWLNAASRLKFPSTFSGLANRKVELNGEAYFEIAKDKKHAFIVNAKGQQVEVLGTHFNINSYDDEVSTRTTLLEGAVSVAVLNGNHQDDVVLRPNQQAISTDKGHLTIRDVDAAEIASWKSGKFIFNSEALGSIMKQAERWYNVRVVFQDDVKDLKLTGAISRYENISGLLRTLEATDEVRFKIEGNQIFISKKR